MSSGSEAGSYLRLIDVCITQLKAQGPSRTCNESKEEEEESEVFERGSGCNGGVWGEREGQSAAPDAVIPGLKAVASCKE